VIHYQLRPKSICRTAEAGEQQIKYTEAKVGLAAKRRARKIPNASQPAPSKVHREGSICGTCA
jgi:hypothetical protein